jgi:hypothetical protein
MALKLFKVQLTIEVKADKNDPDHVREQVYEQLQMLMESEELDYVLDEEDEEVEEDN